MFCPLDQSAFQIVVELLGTEAVVLMMRRGWASEEDTRSSFQVVRSWLAESRGFSTHERPTLNTAGWRTRWKKSSFQEPQVLQEDYVINDLVVKSEVCLTSQ